MSEQEHATEAHGPRPSTDGRTVHQRMADAIADVSAVAKQSADKVSYQFRSVEAVMNHLHPILAKHGLFPSPHVLEDWRLDMIPGTNNRQQAQTVFRMAVDMYGAAGDSVRLGPGLAQSHDYGDKAVYQAQQNAYKYVLIESFMIPTQDLEDQDARPADDVPAADLSKLEVSIGRADLLGVKGEWDRTREWAKQSQDHADQAVESLEQRITDHRNKQAAESAPEPPATSGDREAPEKAGTSTGVPDGAGEEAAREVAAAELGEGADEDGETITLETQTQLQEAARELGWKQSKLLVRARAIAEGMDEALPTSLSQVSVKVAMELFADLQQAKETA